MPNLNEIVDVYLMRRCVQYALTVDDPKRNDVRKCSRKWMGK